MPPSKLNHSLLAYFPGTPRDSQKKILKSVQEAINKNKKFIIIQAPTGAGKSHVGATLAESSNAPSQKYTDLITTNKMFKKTADNKSYEYAEEALKEDSFGAYILTITKALQEQYLGLFSQCKYLKGRASYMCTEDDTFDCDIAPCRQSTKLLNTCIDNGLCPYVNDRNEAVGSKMSVLNYNMFLCLPDHVKKRQYLICDEASELEESLIGSFSVNINYETLKKNNIKTTKVLTDEAGKGLLWLTDLANLINDEMKATLLPRAMSKMTANEKKKIYKLKYLKNLHGKIIDIISNWYKCEFIIEQTGESVSFTPLYVNTLADHIFKHADTVVLMSATIIDHKTFAKSLGITDYEYIEVPSTFKAENSPIYCPGNYKLNHSLIDNNLPKVVRQALDICDHYSKDNGIIHTHTFKITNAIQDRVGSNKRFLFREAGITNEQIVEEHFLRNDHTVLVSPSLGLGTDLYGDHGRFQIIMKLPYPPLGNKRIKILASRDKKWYTMKMLTKLLQMTGRCTRDEKDFSDTFILDGSALCILKNNWNNLPLWFKDRLQ